MPRRARSATTRIRPAAVRGPAPAGTHRLYREEIAALEEELQEKRRRIRARLAEAASAVGS
ncbi:MAG TPA: hypothetical protein VN213_11845 [Solirubrobacteraceae bacterium]|nr:hypothetical protein [Solirubrobacteraceae bacterium]